MKTPRRNIGRIVIHGLASCLVLAWLNLAADARELPEGLRHSVRRTNLPCVVHILEVDPRLLRIESGLSRTYGVSREKVSTMALKRGALAAVNGGFFRREGRYDGEPLGIMKWRGQWLSEPDRGRGAIGWKDGGLKAFIDRLDLERKLLIGNRALTIDGINRPRNKREAILYTSGFFHTTMTEPGGTEVLVRCGKVTDIKVGMGDSPVPADGFIYSIGPTSKITVRDVSTGERARVFYRPRPRGETKLWPTLWQGVDHIVGGAPILIEKGQIVSDYLRERVAPGFVEKRHPRTSVGLRKDGTWVFVVADGRQPGYSEGMTLKELASTMKSLGCVNALNLDGGGSTTLFLDGRVVNSPSDLTGERLVSDAILVLEREPIR